MDPPVELRQLRYFVAVAEELHFGRAADRLHVSQSPLSRAIRELERQLGVVLFVRTTRRVELTPAGTALLERARTALADVDVAVDSARRAAAPPRDALAIGYGPLTRATADEIAAAATNEPVRLDEGITLELLPRVGAGDLDAAAVMETPAAARSHGVRIDVLRDEPLLAALPAEHPCAGAGAIPLADFVRECVLLPREPAGTAFNAWLRAVLRTEGHELDRTLETMSAPWDRRLPLVASGEAVTAVVREWADPPIPGVVLVPFDPPLSFPIDLASTHPPTDGGRTLLESALALRDREGWLTRRRARTQLPGD